jgi:hypothetical protein
MIPPARIALSRNFTGGEGVAATVPAFKSPRTPLKFVKTTAKIGLLAMLVGLSGLLVIQSLPAPQPSYQGIRLSHWLQDLDFGTRTPRSTAARFAIQRMGTNCVPALIFYLRCHDSSMKRRYAWFMDAYLRKGVDLDQDWHRRAAKACEILGNQAESAIPALVERAELPDAVSALSKMLPITTSVLTNLLTVGKPAPRINAALALKPCLANADWAMPAILALTNALLDPDFQVRSAAVYTLGSSSNHQDLIMQALTGILSTTNLTLQIAIINSLGGFGHAAQSAVPQLLTIWRSDTQIPSTFLLTALERIDQDAAIQDFLEELKCPESLLRIRASLALGSLVRTSDQIQRVIPAMLNLTTNSDFSVRGSGFFGLAIFAPQLPELFLLLDQVLRDNWPELPTVISGLISGLNRFNGSRQKVVPFLLEGATNPEMSGDMRASSVKALKRVAPEIAAKAGLN